MTDYFVNGDTTGHTINNRAYGPGSDSNPGTDISAPKSTIGAAGTAAAHSDTIYICGAIDLFDGVYSEVITSLDALSYFSDGIVTVQATSGESQVLYNNELAGDVSFSGDGFIFDPLLYAPDNIYNRGGNLAFVNVEVKSASDSTIRLHSDSVVTSFTDSVLSSSGATSELFDVGGADIGVVLSACTVGLSDSAVLVSGNTTGFDLASSDNQWAIDLLSTFLSLVNSGDYVFDGEAFNIENVSSLIAAETIDSGTLTLKNSTLNFLNASLAGGIDVNSGVWAIDINTNSINVDDWIDEEDVIFSQNQADPKITDNVIDVRNVGTVTRTNGIGISVSVAGSYGTAIVTGNTYRTLADSNAIKVNGQMSSTVAIGADISYNKYYGARYYGQNPSPNLAHPIFAKYIADFKIHHNEIYGSSGYGLLVKGGDSTGISTATGDGIHSNLILDSYLYGIYVKGFASTKIQQNTIIGLTAQADCLLHIGINDADHDSLPSTNTTLKNNLLFSDTRVLVSVDSDSQTGTTGDYNAYISSIDPAGAPFEIGGVAKTWAEWVALAGESNSVYVHNDSGVYKVYSGSAPTVLVATLDYCPVSSVGKLVHRDDNPLLDVDTWIDGINNTGDTDPFGGYVLGLPDIGAHQWNPKSHSSFLHIGK